MIQAMCGEKRMGKRGSQFLRSKPSFGDGRGGLPLGRRPVPGSLLEMTRFGGSSVVLPFVVLLLTMPLLFRVEELRETDGRLVRSPLEQGCGGST
jgi:hypothetical protein